MIFETLNESAERRELLLVNGGLCHWHLRRDGQITIREILVLPESCSAGVGRYMVEQLKQVPGALSIFAKCPMDLTANSWYEHLGFQSEGTEITRTGREVQLWRLSLHGE